MKQKYSCEKHVLRQGIIKSSPSHINHTKLVTSNHCWELGYVF